MAVVLVSVAVNCAEADDVGDAGSNTARQRAAPSNSTRAHAVKVDIASGMFDVYDTECCKRIEREGKGRKEEGR